MGTGALGPVYRARESDGGRTVAVKSFHLELTPEQAEIFGNALAHIVNVEISHPAIVAPLAAGLESGTPFMVYEYVAGESLDVTLRREARPADALEWIAALAAAVDAAHARGLEHGTLHLRDVLVSSEGVCVTGFGIARALEHVQLGIPVRRPYAAPEVMAGRRWGPPADRFAVAVLAYELLTGSRPSGNSDQAVADLRKLRPDIADAAGLQQAFRNALADDPAIRSASVTGFVTALARAIGDDVPDGSSGAAPGREPLTMDAPGLPDESPDAQQGASLVDIAYRGDEEAFGVSEPPEQISLPDAVDAPEEPAAGGGRDDGSEARGDQPDRSRRPARSKRRPARGAGAARRSGPVVAVRDDVHMDPLDDRGAVEPPVVRTDYDDDVPPPPSPTSMRSMAPMFAAVAAGVLVTFLVIRGLETSGDEAAGGGPPQSSEAADTGVEWSEATVAGAQRPPAAVRAPVTLAEEPLVPVGDPPLRGADLPAPEAGAVAVDPPVASPPPSGAASLAEAAALPLAAADVPPEREPAVAADVDAASLYVDSRPAGAMVRVDDVTVGVTPVELPDVPEGSHSVRIEMPGYRPWVTEVDVSGTGRVRVGASLEPERR